MRGTWLFFCGVIGIPFPGLFRSCRVFRIQNHAQRLKIRPLDGRTSSIGICEIEYICLVVLVTIDRVFTQIDLSHISRIRQVYQVYGEPRRNIVVPRHLLAVLAIGSGCFSCCFIGSHIQI